MAIKSFLSENGFSVGSVGSTPIEVIDTSGNVTGVSLTSSGGIITANTSIPSLRARDNITGPSGTISVDASYNVSWTGRFIVISNGGTASTFSASGYFDITQPASGTVITGLNGAANATVVSGGIPLASWQALYYILPIGSGATSVDANFRIVSYTANNLNIPAEWILICLRNGDTGYIYFPNGVVLGPGNSSSYSAQASANAANTLVRRDSSGNFSAGTITAALSGNATTATTATDSNALNGISAVNLYNNMGDAHTARTSFDATTPSYGFGYRFVQGNTNGPGTGGAQFYSWYIGLGSGYPSTGAGSYGAMFAVDRSVTTPYLSVRFNEANSFSSWYKIRAGAADVWSTGRTLTIGSTGKSVDGSVNVSWSASEIGTSANTANTVVVRDGSGNFNAGTISAGTINATTFSDGYNTYTLAQINRSGGAVELQYGKTGAGENVHFFGNTANRWAWQPDTGKLVIGSAGDTNLYRGAANILKTDDDFAANVITGTRLEATNSNTTQIFLNSTGSGSKEIVFQNNGSTAGYVWHSGTYVGLGGGSATNSLFVTTASGNVGIGTTSPSSILDASLSSGATSGFRFKGYSDASTSYLLSLGTQTYSDVFQVRSVNGLVTMGIVGAVGANPDLAFMTNTTERMRILSSGNVGIGTAGPSVKLHVYGADQRMMISTSAVDAASLTIGQWDGATNRIESANRKLLITSYSTGISMGMSGTEHVQISATGALTSTISTTSPIYYDSANSSFYCDPAGTSALAGATLSNDPASDRSAITRVWSTSRGENLVTNGSGLMASNYNFSGLTFDASQTHGGGGSFRKNTANGSAANDEYMPVDIEKTYRLVAWARSGEDGGTNYNPSNYQYLGISPLDIDGNLIAPFYYSKYPGSTDTTLAVALNTGATTMTLTSSAGWLNAAGAGAYQRQIVWYGYTNSKGYTYPNYTYTRNLSWDISSTYQANGMWAAGGISGNVVTLTAPWPGPNIPAGTAVRNTNSGGTYKYITLSGSVPNTWTRYEGYIGGIDTGGDQFLNKFPYGTAFVKLIFLINYHGLADNNIRYSDIWFSETSSRNLEEASTVFKGVVTTSFQSFAGDKAFTGSVSSAGFYNAADSTNRFVQGSIVLRNSAPAIYFRDTDHNSAMIHVNSNILYVLRGGVDTESWSQVNGRWPMEIDLTNNNMSIGGNLTVAAGTGTVTAATFTGNATTATTLQTARNIAGVSFNGSADIAITGQNISTSAATAANDIEVAKYMRWKNYGNAHILIDASAGTAPPGSAIDRYTPANTITNAGAGSNTWGEAISLMGWNGTSTYGVRVDRARSIDNQANSATTTAATANTASTIVLRDGSGNFNAGTITATSFSGSGAGLSSSTVPIASLVAGDYSSKITSGTYSISISGNAATASTSSLITSSDIRTLAPSNGTATRALFGFTSWTNNNNSPYADYFLLRSYSDASGGNDNLVMFRKDAIGMRIWQQGWGSTTAFSTYKDVAFTDGTGASGTWGINITGNAATATNATNVSGLTLTSSANGIDPNSVTQNQIGYNNSVSLYGQNDGGLYSSAYSSSWIHQIYGDFRTGQIAIRGKNNGTWQSWRFVLDSSNYTTYTGAFTSANTANTNVSRDGSGNFSAGTITATGLTVPASGICNLYSIRSDYYADAGGTHLFKFAQTSGVTRHLNLSVDTTDPSTATNSTGISWGSRGDSSRYYMISVPQENYNSSGNYTKLELAWHTGIKIGASPTYGGTRFYNNSPFIGTEIFSVGRGDDHVRVQNNLYAAQLIDISNTAYYVDPAGNTRLAGSIQVDGSIGVGTTASGTAGEIRATNNITAYYSDERLKTKLGPIQDPIEKVKSLSGFYFAPNDTAMALGYQKTVDVGVSAQEVNTILPEIIAPAPIDPQYMTVRYEKLIPLLIEAIKAQQSQIEDLQKKISELQPNK